MPTSQFFGCVQSEDQGSNLITELRIPRGFAVGSGNNVAVAVSFGTTARTCTVTDDQGGTYTRRVNVVRGQRFQIWTRENITNAPRTVIVQIDSTGSAYLAAAWGEACGVGAFDVAGGTTGTSTTPNSGSITPANGALVFFGAIQDSSATFLTSWTPDSGFETMWAELMLSFQYGQWKLHTSGATTPGTTMSASRGWCGGAVSWVADTGAGTAPSTTVPLIHAMNHNSFPNSGAPTTPYKVQGPSAGASRIAMLFEDNPGIDITGITDTDGNTWTKHADIPGDGGGGVNEFWTAPVTGGSNTNIISAAFTGSNAGSFLTFFHLRNDGGIDAAVTTTAKGNNASTSTQAGTTTTPSTTTGLLIGLMGVQSNTVTSVDIGNFTSCTTTPTIASPAQLMQNNGYVIQYPTSTSGIQRTWTLNGVPNNWQELNVFVKVAAGTTDGAGSASGVATVAGIALAIFAAVAAAAGIGAASGVAAETAASVGSASGAATSASVGHSIFSGIASAVGIGTATGIAPGATTDAVGAAIGVGAANGVGSSTAASLAASTGQSTATATGSPTAAGIAVSTATSTAAAVGSAGGSVAEAAATATVLGVGVGLEIRSAVGSAAATSTASAIAAQLLTLTITESLVTALTIEESLV